MRNLLIAFALLAALPASAQNNNPRPGSAPAPAEPARTTPPPAGWLGAGAPIPAELTALQNEARDYCPTLDANSVSDDTQGYFTCACAAGQLTDQDWADYDNAYSGPFMPVDDATLIVEALRTSSNMADVGNRIYSNIGDTADSILSSCYVK